MIGISKLYCGTVTEGDLLRYSNNEDLPSNLLQFAKNKKPVIVWNSLKKCNLKCIHCYINANIEGLNSELTTDEAKRMIEDLAEYKVPVLLISGGEPLLRNDIFEIASFAKKLGLRVVLSTNGTLITSEKAEKLKESGFSYIGISLDGIGEINDKFRGVKGAYDLALNGFKNCKSVSLKSGLRLTLTKWNVDDLPEIFDFIEKEEVERACFYHLVYTGRAKELINEDIPLTEKRRVIDYIIEKTNDFHSRGLKKDILTVDNHTDGVYLYLKLRKIDSEKAKSALKLLQRNGGNNSGIGIGCIDNSGFVHPDQFWRNHTFGNIKEKKFKDIWESSDNSILTGLRDRKKLLKGKCGRCVWLDICNGNFRARAEAVFNDPWMEDPACYLTSEEISTRI